MIQLTIDDAIRAGESAMHRAADAAEVIAPNFSSRAATYMLACLTLDGPTSGEVLVEKCKAAGLVPANGDRAFGRAFTVLVARGARVLRSDLPRKRGHGTSGARLYGRPAA